MGWRPTRNSRRWTSRAGRQAVRASRGRQEAAEQGIRPLLISPTVSPRPVDARDRSLEPGVPVREKVDPKGPGRVPAPMAGVAKVLVGQGARVEARQQVETTYLSCTIVAEQGAEDQLGAFCTPEG